MKNLMLIFIICSGLFACKKRDEKPAALNGKWKLKETLDAWSEKNEGWTPTKDANDWYVQFNPDGSIKSDNPDNTWLSYKAIDSVSLQVTMKSIPGPQTIAYNLSGNDLSVRSATKRAATAINGFNKWMWPRLININ